MSSGDTDHSRSPNTTSTSPASSRRSSRDYQESPNPAQQPAEHGSPGAQPDGGDVKPDRLIGAGRGQGGHHRPVTASDSQAPTAATPA